MQELDPKAETEASTCRGLTWGWGFWRPRIFSVQMCQGSPLCLPFCCDGAEKPLKSSRAKSNQSGVSSGILLRF